MTESVVQFDGQALFGAGQHRIEVDSRQRERVEHGFGGLDGILSVDLGERERSLVQTGTLILQSLAQLDVVKTGIEKYIDGMAHRLVDHDGRTYEQVRMDRFERKETVAMANQVRCQYEIQYTQLRA